LERLRIPSVSWYVDSPAIILSLYDGPRSELAYFFVWDPTYIPAVQAQGFEKVFPLPLATDPEIFTPQAARERPNGGGQVVFVGNSLIGSARKKLSRLPGGPEFQEIFQELLQASEARPFQPFPALLAEKSLEGHPLITGLDRQGRSDLEAALLWSATREYRRSCLQELAPFEPVIYGDVGWGELLAGSYRLRPEVNYYEDLPRIYGSCALNFNATSLQMKAAVNQRVFDVPASGGFLLTDFREQLSELFHLEKEVAYFREPGEISQLARYYLAHPEVRQKMAARARSRVLQEHTYRHRVAAMLDTMRRTL
jgi:spore maturation protein CgeB